MAYYETLTQMYATQLDPVKGWWDERQLTFIAPSEDDGGGGIKSVSAGMVGYLDTNGFFIKGLPDAVNVMPLFARANTADNDVRRIEGNISGQASSYDGTNPESLFVGLPCLVATGGYELGTTEFLSTSTYTPNVILSSDVNGDGAAAGIMAPIGDVGGGGGDSLKERMGCGIVSQGVKANKHGINMLYFWACPIWLDILA